MGEEASQPAPEEPAPPSTNGGQTAGRNERGRFVKGCAPGPGNPHASVIAAQRAIFFRSLRATDTKKALATIRNIMNNKEARPADRLAASMALLDRAIGRVVEADVLERLERLEQLFGEGKKDR